jgi:peptidoglycan/xylan/chitin deacetylase (PgdA/CDA1 family)
MREEIRLPPWPNGATAAVSLTFDVDAESSWIDRYPDDSNRRLTLLSEARFGIVRGLPRIVDLLEDAGIKATFFVPGHTADRFPEAIQLVAEAGHEVAHHGYLHRQNHMLSVAEAEEEIERGTASLTNCIGYQPVGYRSPYWQLTPETLELLVAREFRYDSSLMEDDRPYREIAAEGSIIELPVHWSLDDAPYFYFGEHGGNVAGPERVRAVWMGQVQEASRDGGHVVLTMHPEIIGRGYTVALLRTLLADLRAFGSLWFSPMRRVAEHVMTSRAPSR